MADWSRFIVPDEALRFPKGERFLKGPISMKWLNAAACLPGKALHVAICIWHVSGVTRSLQVKISSEVLGNMGIKRHAGYRALKSLERRGLVKVVRHRGRCPVVTIKAI